jgi:hypothetical protein
MLQVQQRKDSIAEIRSLGGSLRLEFCPDFAGNGLASGGTPSRSCDNDRIGATPDIRNPGRLQPLEKSNRAIGR